MRRVYILLLFFCVLNILDYLSTMLAIGYGAVEGNPITNIFVKYDTLHFYKLAGVGFICIYLIHAAKRNLKSQLRVIKLLYGANILYGFIAVSNVVVYFLQKNQYL